MIKKRGDGRERERRERLTESLRDSHNKQTHTHTLEIKISTHTSTHTHLQLINVESSHVLVIARMTDIPFVRRFLSLF